MKVSWIKVGTLSLLYFAQGAPYGFQSACLPILLRSQGMSFTSLGLMKLLFIPWICKPLFAPLIDKYFNRKWWLQKVQILREINVSHFCEMFFFSEYVSPRIHLSSNKHIIRRIANWIFVNFNVLFELIFGCSRYCS